MVKRVPASILDPSLQVGKFPAKASRGGRKDLQGECKSIGFQPTISSRLRWVTRPQLGGGGAKVCAQASSKDKVEIRWEAQFLQALTSEPAGTEQIPGMMLVWAGLREAIPISHTRTLRLAPEKGGAVKGNVCLGLHLLVPVHSLGSLAPVRDVLCLCT